MNNRMERRAGWPVYAHWWKPGDLGNAQEEDIKAIRMAQDSLGRDLANNSPDDLMDDKAQGLLREHGLPKHLLGPLTYGLIEAAIEGWKSAERRTLGTEPLVFQGGVAPSETAPAPTVVVLIETPEPVVVSFECQIAWNYAPPFAPNHDPSALEFKRFQIQLAG